MLFTVVRTKSGLEDGSPVVFVHKRAHRLDYDVHVAILIIAFGTLCWLVSRGPLFFKHECHQCKSTRVSSCLHFYI
jgi:hypothetical protein